MDFDSIINEIRSDFEWLNYDVVRNDESAHDTTLTLKPRDGGNRQSFKLRIVYTRLQS